MPRKKSHPSTHPGSTSLNTCVRLPIVTLPTNSPGIPASIKLLECLYPDSTLLLTNWSACHAKMGNDNEDIARKQQEKSALLKLKMRVDAMLESEMQTGANVDFGIDQRLDDENSRKERKRLEGQGESMRVDKRKVPDAENEDSSLSSAEAAPKAKRRKVSTSQAAVASVFQRNIQSTPTEPPTNDTILQAPTTADPTNKASADTEGSDTESDLSIISNVTELAPTPQKETHPQLAVSPARKHQTRTQVSTPTMPMFSPTTSLPNPVDQKTGKLATNEQNGESRVLDPDPHRSYIHHAINTLQFEDQPKDSPAWITGLRKPIHHAGLTDVQNLEIKIRMWSDEIERLVSIRSKLPVPVFEGSGAGDDGHRNARLQKGRTKGVDIVDREWTYTHWNRTQEVQLGRSKKRVVARGVWKWVVGKEIQGMLLDEWPRDVWGEPLGWAVKREQGEDDEEEEEDGDSVEESEDEEFWGKLVADMGDSGGDLEEEESERDKVLADPTSCSLSSRPHSRLP
jgi:hypothetical protein